MTSQQQDASTTILDMNDRDVREWVFLIGGCIPLVVAVLLTVVSPSENTSRFVGLGSAIAGAALLTAARTFESDGPSLVTGYFTCFFASMVVCGLYLLAAGAGPQEEYQVIWVLFGATVVAFALNLGSFNALTVRWNLVKQNWNSIQILLMRRRDLIDRLLAISKGFQEHEQKVFVGVAEARAAATNSGPIAARLHSENALGVQVNRLVAVAESYPSLRSSELVRPLMAEMINTENGLASVRETYNTTVGGYNTDRAVFPAAITAFFFGFKEAPYWSGDE